MAERTRAVDRELLILLIAFISLALIARATGRSEGFVVETATSLQLSRSAATLYLDDASTNPYWAPAHAFTRRLAPVYSSGATLTSPADMTPFLQ